MSEFIVTDDLIDDVYRELSDKAISRTTITAVLNALIDARPNLMYVVPAPPVPVQLPGQPAPLSPALISVDTVRSAFNAGRQSEIAGQDGNEAWFAFADRNGVIVPPWSNAPYMPITDVGDAIREAESIVRRANDKLNQLEKNSSLKEHERAALSAAITCMNQEGVQG